MSHAPVTGPLAALAAELRARGVRVGVGELLAATRALAAVDPASRAQAYLALRPVLCARRADLAAFDEAFRVIFSREVELPPPPDFLRDARAVLPRVGIPDPPKAPGAQPAGDPVPVPAAYSDVELLREKDFALYTDAERAAARELLARLARRGPRRASRRLRPARRRTAEPDLRRTLRAAQRTHGEPFRRAWRRPGTRPRPVVLVCDVSGSMAPYARMLLAYMQASVAAHRRVEAFTFGTRLTRVTRELAGRDPDRALARAAAAAPDIGGGTRIGGALGELNRDHGRRVGRGSVVVILSDGWDRGDPEDLAAELARLQLCAHTLIWLNPLKAQPGYEPLTRGMMAALPHIDHFLSGESIASLEELAELLEGGM